MNDYPMTIEPRAVPYVRPHEKKKKKRRILPFALLFLIFCGILSYPFLPDGIKNGMSAWMSELIPSESSDTDQSTAETTTDGATTPEATPPAQTTIPEGMTAIQNVDLSADKQGIYAENPTDAILDGLLPAFPKEAPSGISVLIINTHSFESYAPEEMSYYGDPAFAVGGETEDRVGAVAETLARVLSEHGVEAFYYDCMIESTLGSYQTAGRILDILLQDHPSTVLVLDIHRALDKSESGALLKPTAQINGETAAQMRIVIGDGDEFEENAKAALALQEMAKIEYPELMMPLAVREGSFLQGRGVPVLTLEIGTAANTAEEAALAAEYLAGVIAGKME